jgi:hypothetical protein
MVWQQWVLVTVFVIGSLISVAMIGRPRTPTTPGQVVLGLIINALLIWAVVSITV